MVIVDYGIGNLFSLKSSLDFLGFSCTVTSDPKEISKADKIFLPGVGAFADAIHKLSENGLDQIIRQRAADGVPLLGICLGMQMLFNKSYEYGEHAGLGLIPGDVCPIAADLSQPLKIPQMGWNSLRFRRESPLFRYIHDGDFVYYVHSYYAKNCAESIIATSDYGVEITGAVQNGNVYGTQFHPEKSGQVGLAILQAFCEL